MRRVEQSTQILIDILVEDILTCDLCSIRMCLSPANRIPKNLDCSHTYCVKCLEQLKTGMGMFSTIICPKCSVETTLGISGVMGLKNNHTVISVINILEAFNAITCSSCHVKPATLQCQTCLDTPNICDSCQSIEGSIHAFHDLRPLNLDFNLQRPQHQTPLRKSSEDEEVIVECPRSIVGKVLSSPRNSFERIRSDTQCSVEVRRLSDRDSPAQITIRGPKQNVRRAQSMVENIMDSVVLPIESEGDEEHRDEYVVDITFHEAIEIFELRYSMVLNIASQTQTEILLIPHSQDERMRIVVIRASPTGTHPRTNVARKLILKMIEESDQDKLVKRFEPPPISEHGEISEVVVLSNIQFHKLASAGFTQLQRIAERVGCRIDASEDGNSGLVIIKGNAIQVREAKHLLKQVLDNRPHSFTSTLPAPPGFSLLQNPSSAPSKSLIHENLNIPPTTFAIPEDRKRPQSFTNFPTDLINKEYTKTCPPISPSSALSRSEKDRTSPLVKTGKSFSFREQKIITTQINCDFESVGKLIGVRGGRIEELRKLTECQIVIKKGENSNMNCIIEINGTPDKVSYAVPLIKMVLGSGDAVMTTVRSILPHQTLPLETVSSAPVSNLNPSPEIVSPKPIPQAEFFTLTQQNSDPIEVATRAESSNRETESAQQDLPDNSYLSLGDHEGTYVSSCSSSDDEEDQDNSQFQGSPDSKSSMSKTRQKYNISPPPSPPPSSVFPEYFIRSQNKKIIETIVCPKGKISKSEIDEISLFTRCKITVQDADYNRKDQIIQFQGLPDQRELAKLLVDAILKPGNFKSPQLSGKDGYDGVVRTVDCPPHFIPVLIGPGGSTIESIQTQSQTKILINENIDEDRPPTLSIIGTHAGVDQAVQLLDRLVTNQRFKYRHNNPILTQSARARSLPIMSRTSENVALPPSDYEEEFTYEDEPNPEEGGGRTVMVASPPPTNTKNSSPSVGAFAMMSNRPPPLQNPPTRQNSIVSDSSVASSVFDGLNFSRSSSIGSNQPSSPGTPIPGSPPPRNTSLQLPEEPKPLVISQNDLLLEDVIFCPMDKVAQVIGKRGSILRELKRLSNCEIIVNQDSPREAANVPPSPLAKGSTNKTKKRGQSPPPTPSGSQNKSASMNWEQGAENIPSSPQPIKILGANQSDINRAKELILAVIELGPVAALGMETVKMDCPLDKVPLVIGIKGMTAKEMMRRTGCKIHVNETAPEGSTMCSIELTGTAEQIDQATKIIAHVLEYGTKALGKRFQRAFQKDGEGNQLESIETHESHE